MIYAQTIHDLHGQVLVPQSTPDELARIVANAPKDQYPVLTTEPGYIHVAVVTSPYPAKAMQDRRRVCDEIQSQNHQVLAVRNVAVNATAAMPTYASVIFHAARG